MSAVTPEITYRLFDRKNPASAPEKEAVASFLFTHLDQFGDPKEDILKCLGYVFKTGAGEGGFVFTASDEEEMVGAVIVNETGMNGYIPENILVYIAVHQKTRGKGVGKSLMQKALSRANGSVALHVEPDNPARKLYERLGFTNKYLEMRYFKK